MRVRTSVAGSPLTPALSPEYRGEGELQHRDRHALAALHRGFVGAQADHRPVGARFGIRQRRLAVEDRLQEMVHEMRVTAPMPAALQEAEVIRVLDRGGLREATDRLRQSARV